MDGVYRYIVCTDCRAGWLITLTLIDRYRLMQVICKAQMLKSFGLNMRSGIQGKASSWFLRNGQTVSENRVRSQFLMKRGGLPLSCLKSFIAIPNAYFFPVKAVANSEGCLQAEDNWFLIIMRNYWAEEHSQNLPLSVYICYRLFISK